MFNLDNILIASASRRKACKNCNENSLLPNSTGKVEEMMKSKNPLDQRYLLADFGISTKINPNGESFQIMEGDYAYMPLETSNFDKMKSNEIEVFKLDVFSLGFVCFLLMTGQEAPLRGEEWKRFRSDASVRSMLEETNYSEKLKEMVLSCMLQSVEKRPTSFELYKMCILRTDIIEQSLLRKQYNMIDRRIEAFSTAPALLSKINQPHLSQKINPLKLSLLYNVPIVSPNELK